MPETIIERLMAEPTKNYLSGSEKKDYRSIRKFHQFNFKAIFAFVINLK